MKKQHPKLSQKKARNARAQETDAEREKHKNPAAVALGRLGGLIGGKARARKLTAEQRSGIARRAAEARWKNRPIKSKPS